jgi:hypothetical protein
MEMSSDGKRFEFRQGNEAREVCRQESAFNPKSRSRPSPYNEKMVRRIPPSTSDVPIWCLRKIMNSKE